MDAVTCTFGLEYITFTLHVYPSHHEMGIQNPIWDFGFPLGCFRQKIKEKNKRKEKKKEEKRREIYQNKG